MKILRALALATALAALPAGALPTQAGTTASQDTLAAARELLALMSEDMIAKLVGQVTDRMWPSIESRLRAYNPDIDPSSLAGLRVELERIQLDYMKNVVKEGPEIYARHFTAEELREIISFYSTPVGAKLLEMTPQLTEEVTGMITPHMPKFYENTLEAFAKVLRSKGYAI